MKCNLCPRSCDIDRHTQKGFCLTGDEILIARAAKHFWEEPPISGTKGSGTVFFSGCSLKCVYCQNFEISHKARGKAVSENELADIEKIAKLSHVEIEGMFTHFSKADETDKTFAKNQLKKYMEFAEALESRGIQIPCKHVCNSAGIIDIPEGDLDMVRFGITMYGMYPTDEVTMDRMPVVPAMEVKTHIAYIKTLPAGVGISYSGTYVTDKETSSGPGLRFSPWSLNHSWY